MSLARKLLAPSGEFTPLDLFGPSDVGGWYDIQDPSTMNTLSDQTGTTPGIGDPVGYIEDQSGNGNHLTQATAANRAILGNTDDPSTTGRWFLTFDGNSDQYLTSTGFFGGSVTEFTLAGGFLTDTTDDFEASGRRFISLGNAFDGTAVAGDRETFAQARDQSLRFDGATTGAGSETITQNVAYIRLSTRNGNAVVDRIDAVENINTTVTLNPTIDELAISVVVSAFRPSGDIFSIFAIDRELTSTEIDNLETYLADVSGVTL